MAHASASVDRIGREASEMSVSPLQNFWNPPPVPEVPTVTLVPGVAFWNSSATASVTGATVLDPSTVIRLRRGAASRRLLCSTAATGDGPAHQTQAYEGRTSD